MKLKLSFLGAADTVTGSRTLIEYAGKKFLVDCGLFQGTKPVRGRNWNQFRPEPESIDAVFLTHAHLDHCGYLPKLVKNGFKGKVWTTEGTADLARIILLDAAYLETEQAQYANKTGYSRHKPAEPLFEKEDAEKAISQIQRNTRQEWHEVMKGVSVRFLRAGHIIGASLVQFAFDVEGRTEYITFSGDLGNNRSLLMKGPVTLKHTDTLILESTYGARRHPRCDVEAEFAKIVNRTVERGGVLVIPSFAVGRAQEITYLVRRLEDAGKIPKVPVLLDSPMAIQAMEICLSHPEDQIVDSAFLGEGDNFRPQFFETVETPDESMLACMRDGPAIVISASGMLAGGRILHHLKARLPDRKNTLMFTGYQADGTKGRFLQDNQDTLQTLRIHHKEIEIACEVLTFDAMSAHADYEDILDWLGQMGTLPKKILINHGNPDAQRTLASMIQRQYNINCRPSCDYPQHEWTFN